MNEMFSLTPALATGLLLGAMFFGGLWWTVQKAISSERSAVWFSVSFLLRMSVALAGFYFIARGSWERTLMCLLGFFIARVIVSRLIRTAKKPAHAA